MGTRRLAREYCLKMLYLADISKTNKTKELSLFGLETLKEDALTFANNIITETLKNKDLIDKTIIKYAKNWTLDRMPALDRNILRIATYEILFTDIPIAAIIDEAIEIAKKYSTENSGRFVNGILDKIKNERTN
ncbi:MAG: transcription antitermination factor NusB [Elusimicrobiaceae bacterium]|jgi:transcription antitermination protein NusB|nr:transcription antitermination factor NusB [Elusimicrobiaceae bacterium]MBT3955635.1 transcription antitermination factor NusB [Elusimicrobiaceae bacterium]MBT4008749.1 transcription antitermination factor NusB [Elusimicrobiaceae bacterium]MBT4402790.1 transcription antitermination factor NusB [Elusimicrobiaceae bacterium]MBT4439575.1 transcription antitermination factor NusB [Elusimicrobiaceae bacterium]